MKNVLAILLMTTMIAACGGGNDSGSGSGSGADTGGADTGGGDTGGGDTGGGDTGGGDTGGGDTGGGDTGGGDTGGGGTGGGDTGGGDTGGGDTGGGDTGGGDTGGGDTGGGDTGGGDTGGGDTGGGDTGGGDTGGGDTGGGDVSKEVNPFANGKIPTSSEELRNASIGNYFTFKFDPVAGTYEVLTDDVGYAEAGTYDAGTKTFTQASCYTADADAIECSANGSTFTFDEVFGSLVGDGLVLLDESALVPLGYNPTDEANLPSGKVIYTGKVIANVDSWDESLDEYVEYVDEGVAVTTIDFNTDQVSAEFTDFKDTPGTSANYTGATLEGSKFSGGDLSVTTSEGTIAGGNTYSGGEIYGEQGQELGASVLYVDHENDTFIEGAWNGVKD